MQKLDRDAIDNIYSLTPLQKGILFHYLKDPGSNEYFEQLSLTFTGTIDLDRLELAWNLMIDANQCLRTVFRWEKIGQPIQAVLKHHHLKFIRFDLSALPAGERQERLHTIRANDGENTFDLKDVPLRVTVCLLSQNLLEMIVSYHHILFDGWSSGIILDELLRTYHALIHENQPAIPLKTPFKTYVQWLEQQDHQKSETFWHNLLSGFTHGQAMALTGMTKESTTNTFTASIKHDVHPGFKKNILQFATRHRVTFAEVFYTAWGILLAKYSNADDVVFGTTVSGRDVPVDGIQSMVGLFINTIPLRVQLQSDQSLLETLYRVQRDLTAQKPFQHTPLTQINRFMSGENFHSIVVIENYPLSPRSTGRTSGNGAVNDGLNLLSYSSYEATNYDLVISIAASNAIDEEILIEIDFNAQLYNSGIAWMMARHLELMINHLIHSPSLPISNLCLTGQEEKQLLVSQLNGESSDIPEEWTIHRLFANRAGQYPHRIAAAGNMQMSYHELRQQAKQLADELRRLGLTNGTIVAVSMERRISMLIALLGILEAGAAYLPIDPGYPQERIDYMLKESSAGALVYWQEGLNIRRLNNALTAGRPGPQHASDPAYIIYTSGSTGNPKGVMVEHRAVVNRLVWMQKKYELNDHDVILQKTVFTFDISVCELFRWILPAARIFFLSKLATNDPQLLIDTIRRHHITTADLVPSQLTLLLDALESENPVRALALRWVFTGAEVVRPGLVQRFHRILHETNHTRLINNYGPTEACVDVTWFDCASSPNDVPVPIGKPMDDVSILILDKHFNLLPGGCPGEIHILGKSLARGYLNNPELTHSKFQFVNLKKYLHSNVHHSGRSNTGNSSGEGSLNRNSESDMQNICYKTGDLGMYMPDGNIRFLGRIDRQVKIRGYRVEPGEIENRLLRHPEIKDAAVLPSQDSGGDTFLCAYIVASEEKQDNCFEDYLSQTLPPYMIPSHWLRLDNMPITSSGKIDRSALSRLPIQHGTGSDSRSSLRVSPRTLLEQKLAVIWSDVLAIPREKHSDISIDDHFFRSGGHSLSATSLALKIHKEFNVNVPLSTIFQKPTIRSLAQVIRSASSREEPLIEAAEEKEYYPLTSGEERLYALQKKDPLTTAYNMFQAFELNANLSPEKLEDCFRQLIARHDVLRSSIIMAGVEPVRKMIFPSDVAFRIERVDYTGLEPFIRPFDLSQGPLFRVGLKPAADNKYILLVDIHHIVSDGISAAVMLNQFLLLLEDKKLPPLKLRYCDYSQWRQNHLKSPLMEDQERYWLDVYADSLQPSELPVDFPRPKVQRFDGDTFEFECTKSQTLALISLAQKQNVTLYMLLLSLFALLISKLTNQCEIVIGTPVSGRTHDGLEEVLGMLVNTLPLRVSFCPDDPFHTFLASIKSYTLSALENQEYPFEILVDRLLQRRIITADPSRNPLFDTVFVLQDDLPQSVQSSANYRLTPLPLTRHISKFDLTLFASQDGDVLKFSFEYAVHLFNGASIARFASYFKQITAAVIQSAATPIARISIISETEKKQLLARINDNQAAYPQDRTLHRLFEEQAQKTPGNLALEGPSYHFPGKESIAVSYYELDQKSSRLARSLSQKGIYPEMIAAVRLERSIELVVAILAILKAGAAYMPIDPAYPQERCDFMIKDSAAAAIIDWAGQLQVRHLHDSQYSQGQSIVEPSSPAYVIYTSGTTGKPKGTLIEHRNVVRLMINNRSPFQFSSHDIWTVFHSFSFDFSVWEMYGALLYGGKAIVVPLDVARDPAHFARQLARYCVTVLNQTPSAFYALSAELLSPNPPPLPLRYVIFGGEALNPKRLKLWYNAYPNTRLINMFGITETTVHVTYKEIGPVEMEAGASNIGTAIPTLYTLVVDTAMNLQPVGVPGELCVGGKGVARGYLNRPELTAAKFIANPFGTADSQDIIYTSGDLVKRTPTGDLEYLGRIDQQVKIRGHRIELAEIESRLLDIQSVKEAVVIARQAVQGQSNEHDLCAYVVLQSQHQPDFRAILSRCLPAYMIPAYFVVLDCLPVTSNGKLDRRALPQPSHSTQQNQTPPRDRYDEKLIELWSGVLGVNREHIGIDADFFDLGGHSLKAARLTAEIRVEFNVDIPLPHFFLSPSIRATADMIKKTVELPISSINSVEKRDYYPLSPSQASVFHRHNLALDTCIYNIPVMLEINGPIDREQLQRAFFSLLRRQEALRTSFLLIDGQPVQRIHDTVLFSLEYQVNLNNSASPGLSSDNSNISQFARQLIRPFDLSRAPLLRAGLVPLEPSRSLLVLDVHHIVCDGVSLGIILHEFAAFYESRQLPPLSIQYKDYVQWQNAAGKTSTASETPLSFWRRQFHSLPPVLNLPLEKTRPKVRDFKGASFGFHLTESETRALEQLGRSVSATLNMALLAVYYVFLARLSGQDDIVAGVPAAGRNQPLLKDIIGMFVNTLPLRSRPQPDKPFITFLQEVKQNTLLALENQDFPFETLLSEIDIPVDSSRNPLYDVVFAFQNMDIPRPQIKGMTFKTVDITDDAAILPSSKFDLTLIATPNGQQLSIVFEYAIRLFSESTIQRFSNYFKELVRSVIHTPEAGIAALELTPHEEKQKILYQFSGQPRHYPQDKTLHSMFEDQVSKQPNRIAAADEDSGQVTYYCLNQMADRLAHQLRRRGLSSRSIVALMLPRSIHMLIAFLGILKAGGVYFPIPPEYPAQRIQYMLADSNVTFLISNGKKDENTKGDRLEFREFGDKLVTIDINSIHPDKPQTIEPGISRIRDRLENPLALETFESHKNLDSPCYLLATSGSTGMPKSVLVTHRSVIDHIYAHRETFCEGPDDRFSQTANQGFDGMVSEVWPSLTSGAALYVVPDNVRSDPAVFKDWLIQRRITLSFQTTVMAELLLGEHWPLHGVALRAVITGGEKLNRYNSTKHPFELYNIYGPTEDTVCATWKKVEKISDSSSLPSLPPSVGKPVGNHYVYILDAMMKAQPIGVVGELYLAGAGLALGYLNNPELTAERFLPAQPGHTAYRTNSFHKSSHSNIIYKTGDLARWRANGEIDILGRIDQQVKIRGFRIELAEIEARLLLHPLVKEVIVLNRDQNLMCYYTASGTISSGKLRQFLGQTLPDYMIPTQYFEIPDMPLNPNGKIDRQALSTITPPVQDKPLLSPVIPTDAVEKVVMDTWTEVLQVPHIGLHDNFFEIGGNSIRIVQLHRKLKKVLDTDFPLVKLFEYPTVHSFLTYLNQGQPASASQTDIGTPERSTISKSSAPTAIIGMSGIFPGAANVRELWDNLVNSVESIAFLLPQEVQGPRPEGSIDARGIVENSDYFDAAFFDYTPKEARLMDPQVRLFHQCVWHALEDAGCDPFAYNGRIGLYAGAGSNVYWETLTLIAGAEQGGGGFQEGLLGDKDFMCSRLSYKLDLKGPSYNVQTACSTSLTAVHMAVRGLAGGECDIAIAGGVGLSFPQFRGYVYQEGMIYSADGHCRPFDHKASGTVGGGGAAAVVLKNFASAQQDRDNIHALIIGTAVNNDGIGRVGFTAPGVEGQAAVIRSALTDAALTADAISYIETHGTGTELGDTIEIEALKNAFNHSVKNFKPRSCAIGSIKGNVGHLDAASGAAGLIKTVMALKHRLIPPTLHFTCPNPALALEDSPFYVVSKTTAWPSTHLPRRAGVSSMGMGGSNAHVILEEAPLLYQEDTIPIKPGQHYLFLLSARSAPALQQIRHNLASHLRQFPDTSLADAAYTLQTGRRHFMHRQIVYGSESQDILKTLEHESSNGSTILSRRENPRIIFVFPGQGSQYWKMGFHLYHTHAFFKQTLDQCFEIIDPILNCNVREILFHSEDSSILHRRDLTPPVLFAFEYALACLLMLWGIKPDAMLGYSLGEWVAACVSGVFKLQDALALVARRSLLIHHQTPVGAMTSVPLTEEKLVPLLENNNDISLATVNGPSCIVSGTPERISQFEQLMKAKKLICTRLNSSMATHSRLMNSIRPQFERMFDGLDTAVPGIPFISNLTGDWIQPGQARSAQYWGEHLCSPVRFADGAATLMKEEKTLFIEIGPGRMLSNILRSLPARMPGQLIVNIIRHEHENTTDDSYLLKQLGRMWLYGLKIDWQSYYDGIQLNSKPRRISLPGYPFERQLFQPDPQWLEQLQQLMTGHTIENGITSMPGTAVLNTPDTITGYDSTESIVPGLYDDKPFTPPRNEIEEQTAQVWAEVLGFQRIGIFANFFHINGDSLTATQVTARLRNIYGVEIPIKEFFEDPTIAHTAALIVRKLAGHVRNDGETRIVPREVVSPVVCSFGQRRLWIIDRLMPGKAFYNTPAVQRISGHLNIPVFQRAVDEIIKRHQSLRTVFREENDEPLQIILPHLELPIIVEDLKHLHGSEQDDEVRRRALDQISAPFDLEQGPLLRMTLLCLDSQRYVLLFVSHHIISDIWSMTIFLHELSAVYTAFLNGKPSPLPDLSIQYADYALWQRRLMEGQPAAAQMNYWREQLGTNLPVLELPSDRPRPPVQTFNGDILDYRLTSELSSRISELAKKEQSSFFMVMLSTLNLLLYRYSGQDDILVGTPIAGRSRVELEHVIGYCSNTLVFRTSLKGSPSFIDLLARVKHLAANAFDNQDIPFERLVEEFQPSRYMSHTPLFQVMLITHAPIPESGESTGFKLSTYPIHNKTCKFDLWFSAFEAGDEADEEISGQVEYNTDIFEESTINRLISHFKTLLQGIVDDPDKSIDQIDVMPDEEKQRVLYQFNDTAVQYPERCLHHAFEDQVSRTPEAPALIFERNRLSYAQLNTRANRLALQLRRAGAGNGMPVGIFLERSSEMVIALFAVLKAGGAYLPLDPDYPATRLSFMVEDAALSLLITHSSLSEKLPFFSGTIIPVNHYSSEERTEPVEIDTVLSDPAYIIYTSGSTGRPKGVVVPHRGISNRLEWMQSQYGLTGEDRVLQKTPFSFDVSVWELFWPLIQGAVLVVAKPGGHKDGTYLLDTICQHQITTIHFVPTMLSAFLETPALSRITSLKRVICSGEALPPEYRDRFYDVFSQSVELHNLYGPTEASVDVTYWHCKPGGGTVIPIGRPVANTSMFILDRNMKPVPTGIPGEIHISSVQLAHGYLNRPELTAQRFPIYKNSYSNKHRLYKTGDSGRWRDDGTIEYLGRLDHQVKVRGFRIELGEIEAQLRSHSAIDDAIVLIKEDPPGSGNKKILGYAVPNSDVAGAQIPLMTDGENHSGSYIADWQGVFDDTYSQSQDDIDPFFNISGWNSSYTGAPIPPEEMRLWLDSTVDRILALQPDRILEIGCGTGLFLFRLIPYCSHYIGTDIAGSGLDYIRSQLEKRQDGWAQVKLLQRSADHFDGLEIEAPDLILLNSVIQYFPSAHYLEKVIEGAAKCIKNSGAIFLGDVRSLPLLETFHASVEYYKNGHHSGAEELKRRVSSRVWAERELIVDPKFFYALAQRLPQITGVQILLKHGGYINELSRFRYDVILFIGDREEIEHDVHCLNWLELPTSLEEVRRKLKSTEQLPTVLVVKDIPDVRLVDDFQILKKIDELKHSNKSSLSPNSPHLLPSPEDFASLTEDLPYEVSLTLALDKPGHYNAVFKHRNIQSFPLDVHTNSGVNFQPDEPQTYTNNPSLIRLTRQLAPELRDYLKERVPEYMVPQLFVMLDHLPYTANGKLDRSVLPFPQNLSVTMEPGHSFQQPRNQIEKIFLDTWIKVLGTDAIGMDTNFFQLGGDSIQAIRVISLLNREGCELTIQDLYKHQTIEELARLARLSESSSTEELIDTNLMAEENYDWQELSRQMPAGLEIEDVYPTTPMQRHMMKHLREQSMQSNTEGPMFIFQRIHAPVPLPADFEAMRKTMQILTATYPILRTVILWKNPETPVQVVCKNLDVDVSCWDLSDLEPAVQSERIKQLMREEWSSGIKRPFSHPMRLGVVKLADQLFQHFITCDYPRMDGWGVRFIYGDMAPCYLSVLEGREFHRETNNDYKTYLYRLHRQDLDEAKRYWLKLLADFPGPRSLLKRISGNTFADSSGFARQFIKISHPIAARLDEITRRERLPFSVLVQGVWAAILSRLTGDFDILCGFLSTGRSIASAEVEHMTGHAINILPIRVDVPPSHKLLDWFRQLADRHIEWLRYDYTQIDFIYQWSGLSPTAPLFDTVLVVQNLQFEQQSTLPESGEEWNELNTFHARVDYPLRLDVSTGNEIEVLINYDRHAVTDIVVRNLLENIKTVMQSVAKKSSQTVHDILHQICIELPDLSGEELVPLVNRIQ